MTKKEESERLAVLETHLENIKTNHLAHLQSSILEIDEKVDKMDNRIWRLTIGIIISVIASLFGQEAISILKLLI